MITAIGYVLAALSFACFFFSFYVYWRREKSESAVAPFVFLAAGCVLFGMACIFVGRHYHSVVVAGCAMTVLGAAVYVLGKLAYHLRRLFFHQYAVASDPES